MPNDQNVLLPLKLHDDRLQPDYHISIRLSTSIPIVELVVVPTLEVFWVFFLSKELHPTNSVLYSPQSPHRSSHHILLHPAHPTISTSSSRRAASSLSGLSAAESMSIPTLSAIQTISLTSNGRSPIFFFTSSGNAFAYSSPLGERSESPPIFPSTLYTLSPCFHQLPHPMAGLTLDKYILLGLRCRFIK